MHGGDRRCIARQRGRPVSTTPLQQINLYKSLFRPRRVVLPARQMALLLALFVLALGGFQAQRWWALQPLERAAVAGATAVTQGEQRVAALALQYPVRQPDAAIARNLAGKQAILEQTREVAQRLRSGAYGSVSGLSAYLAGFARQHQDGTWLTAVRVQVGGTAVELAGKTLLPELVPAYLARLGQEAVLKGKNFSELELLSAEDGLDEIAFSVRTLGIIREDDS
jgi:signal transduction histidine kinase